MIRTIFINPVFLQRLIQGALGLITLLFVTSFVSVELQGWYYTFSSLAAIYTIFDLGLSAVLVQLTSHIFSKVKWLPRGGVTGKGVDEFNSLLHQSVTFYIGLASLYLLIVTPVGVFFFSFKEPVIIDWFLPWISLVTFTACNIFSLPFIALVEGSGRINDVYHLRIIQNILGSVFLWGALTFGYKLWALSMLPAVSFIIVLIWLIFLKPTFLMSSFYKRTGRVAWKEQVWPLQWRVGLSWLAGYLLTQIYTPILFHYDSPKVAGQMGLSLTIANMLGLLAQSWIARRVPDMGKSVANKDWEVFDKVFKHDFYVSLLMYLVGSALLISLVLVLNYATHYGERILPIIPFVGLLMVVLINHIAGAFASHLRAYKKEPLVFVTLISTLVTIPIALFGASEFSALGVIAAILLVQITFTLPVTVYCWLKFNREWRID